MSRLFYHEYSELHLKFRRLGLSEYSSVEDLQGIYWQNVAEVQYNIHECVFISVYSPENIVFFSP